MADLKAALVDSKLSKKNFSTQAAESLHCHRSQILEMRKNLKT